MQILIADDDEVSLMKLGSVLTRAGYQVVSALNGLEAWQCLHAVEGPRLAILDWMMPGLDGLALCRRLRALPQRDYVYIILLTARTSRDDFLAGMDAGADDYMRKPFDAQELEARVHVGRRILELQEALRIQATRDSLTNLWNRRVILEMLETEVSRAARTGAFVALALVDLDHFKHVNDTFGHPAGDVVLNETARRLSATVRPYDAVGRLGGEEFLAVLPGCTPAEAVQVGERLRQALAATPIETPTARLSITASVGVASLVPCAGDSGAALLRHADDALYRAKQEGRNRVVVAAWGRETPALVPFRLNGGD